MSSFERRAFLIGLVGLSAACGFRPVYGDGGGGDLVGAVRLQEAVDPESFAFRERMRRRIGHADDGGAFALSYQLELTEEPVAINPASDVTRYRVTAKAKWRLVRQSDGTLAGEGEVKTTGAYDATAAPYATRTARQSERRQLATELAELTATRLLAMMSDA